MICNEIGLAFFLRFLGFRIKYSFCSLLCVNEMQGEFYVGLELNRCRTFLRFFLRFFNFLLRVVFNLSLFDLRVNEIQIKFRFY